MSGVAMFERLGRQNLKYYSPLSAMVESLWFNKRSRFLWWSLFLIQFLRWSLLPSSSEIIHL